MSSPALPGDTIAVLPGSTHQGKSGVCTRLTGGFTWFIPKGKTLEIRAAHHFIQVVKRHTDNPCIPSTHSSTRKTKENRRAANEPRKKKEQTCMDAEHFSLMLAMSITNAGVTEKELIHIVGQIAKLTTKKGKTILCLQEEEEDDDSTAE